MKRIKLNDLVISAMLLGIALLLPFLTGQLREFGAALCPMHLPVLLCGILCGPYLGFAVGITAAPLRFLIFGMPFMPMCLFMAAELAVYGALAGLLRRIFPKKLPYLFLTLILSMLGGRFAYGIVWWAVGTIGGKAFTIPAFITASFVKTLPAVAIQLILIPILVAALTRAGIRKER